MPLILTSFLEKNINLKIMRLIRYNNININAVIRRTALCYINRRIYLLKCVSKNIQIVLTIQKG